MSSRMNILVVGESPNLAFYSWRLHESKYCNITIINNDLLLKNSLADNKGVVWLSEKFNKTRFQPASFYSSFKNFTQTPKPKFDAIILSSTSLQNFATICTDIAPFVNNDTTIVVESTGFLQLESYIQQNLNQLLNHDNFTILSIMNDSDIKKIPNYPVYIHQSKNKVDYIYLGNSLARSNTSDDESASTYTRNEIIAYNRLSQVFEQSNLEVLKINNNLEFLNYQWKFALPRIVFNPLLIIFELDFPVKISKEILAKPLISGLLTEVLILLKKMGCKLIKGYENENLLLNTWSKLYPDTTNNSINPFSEELNSILSNDFNISSSQERKNVLSYIDSPNFFYEFYNQYSLDYDPLLLQPILLADDFSVKTPYLEFLYTALCQFAKLNNATFENNSSIFFLRSDASLKKKLLNLSSMKSLEHRIVEVNNKNRALEENNQSLIKQVNELALQMNSQRMQLAKLSNEKHSLQQQLQRNSFQQTKAPPSRRQSLVGQPNGTAQMQVPQGNGYPQRSPRRASFTTNSGQLNFDVQYQQPQKTGSGGSVGSRNDSTEDLQDLAEMAYIGAKLNGEIRSRTPSPNPPTQKSAPPVGPTRSESFSNVRKSGHPNNFHASQMAVNPSAPKQRTVKRMTSTQSTLPSLETQASFVDKPFGNNSTYLPINDVSSRFTPQSRKNRKSGMPMLTSRASSGTNLSNMLNLNANTNGNSSGNTHRQDIDTYSLYGGASLPNGAVQRPSRNRVSSYKNLSNLTNGNSNGVTNTNGISGSSRIAPPSNSHFNNLVPSSNNSSPPIQQQPQQVPSTPAQKQYHQPPPPLQAQSQPSQAPQQLTTDTITKSNNSNDSKHSFNSSDGIFSNKNNSSIDTQNTASYPNNEKDVPYPNGTTNGAVPNGSSSNLSNNVERSNTITSTKDKKKKKKKSFFLKKNKS